MMRYIVFICLLGLIAAASLKKEDQDAQEIDFDKLAFKNPELFGGDMAGVKFDDDRNGIRHINYRWQPSYQSGYLNKIEIPYMIAPNVANYTDTIESAIEEIENNTCIKFLPRTSESNWVFFYNGERGCWSFVGMYGGAQQINLGKGCYSRNTILHEIIHTIGFYHEHQRSDRDKYLNIYWDNIENRLHDQFFKIRKYDEIILSPFDYNSIMLYDNYAFTKNGKMTMEAKNGVPLIDNDLKPGMSKDDILRINKMYDCERISKLKPRIE